MSTTTDAVRSVTDVRDDIARALTAMDDILNTAREDGDRALTDEERAEFDALRATHGDLEAELAAAAVAEGDADRRSYRDAIRSVSFAPGAAEPFHATRSLGLDAALWASPETVAPIAISDQGIATRSAANVGNPVEQVIVRAGTSTQAPEFAPRLAEVTLGQREAVRSFQAAVADMAIFGMMVDPKATNAADGFQVARSHPFMADRWASVCRAMDVDTSGEGGTWVPTGIGANLHEKVRAAGKVAALFTRIQIPTNPWKMPIEGADATAYRVAEPTSDTENKPTASTPGTVAATFDAEIFGGRVLFSKSLDADSALAILPFVSNKLARSFMIAEEKAVLDGDTDGTHQDSDVGASTTDARTAWDGLRKRALAETVATATSISAANLATVRKAMGKWGVNPADLAFIIGVSNYHGLLADTNLLTVDKMGPNATILNGMVGSVHGVPVIVSEYVREDLNASGVYDGITTTKTYMLCVNRNEWAFGDRMALDVQVDDSVYRETFQRVVVAFQREDFQSIASASTDDNTALAYNVTP